MSEARDEILARIRRALGREGNDQRVRVDLDLRMARPPAHPRPPLGEERVRCFESRLTAVRGGFRRVKDDKLMEAIGACLKEHGLKPVLAVAPALEGLDWPRDWDLRFGPSDGDDRVSVTPCFAAVAETGSVVMLSGPETPATLNFLPEYHIVVVRASQLVDNVEDVWPRLRSAGAPPRAVNFITGPSKTADVEQTIEYGAHGPRALEVVLIDDTAPGTTPRR